MEKIKLENFENEKGKLTIISTVLALLMLSSILLMPNIAPASAQQTTIRYDTYSPGYDYGNVLQYEWTSIQGQTYPGHTGTYSSMGPAPNSPDVLWKIKLDTLIPGYQLNRYLYAFNGMVIATSGNDNGSVIALDGFTGALRWVRSGLTSSGFAWTGGPAGVGVWKVADDLMIVGHYALKISTGEIVWTAVPVNRPASSRGAGQVLFDPRHSWPGGNRYDPESKRFFIGATCWDLSDLSSPPKLIWDITGTYADGSGGDVYGNGVVSGGTSQGFYRGWNASTGALLWETETRGEMGYDGIYYQGKFIRGGTTDNTIYAFDALTGKVLWEYNPDSWFGFWASSLAAAYGNIYYTNNDHYTYCVNAETGQLVWRYKGEIYYQGWPMVADGKVFVTTNTVEAWDYQTGQRGSHNQYTALDAFTGEVIWSMPYICHEPQGGHAIAFGNLYFFPETAGAAFSGVTNEIWCIGQPKDWSMWRNNPAQTAQGQSGPSNLNLLWKADLKGGVTSSPSVANGKVYVGSQDKNIYCLDAYTGDTIWTFKIGSRARASPAVVNGKVYVGPDDGFVYCLDANTGVQQWKKDAGASLLSFDQGGNPIFTPNYAPIQSSPIVVNGRVYVGSLANKTYCFDANTGEQKWSFNTMGEVTASPVVLGNDLYVTCRGNGSLYKLDATSGALQKIIWIPGSAGTYTASVTYNTASPTIVGDGVERVIYYPAQTGMEFAINETTGGLIWRFRWQYYNSRNNFSPLYYAPLKGIIYVDQFHVQMLDTQNVTVYNALLNTTALNTNPPAKYGAKQPNILWDCYVGREMQATPTLAMIGPSDGKIYVSTDSRQIFCLNATSGKKLGFYQNSQLSNGWSAAAVWEGKMYVGNADNNLYAFSDYPKQTIPITLSSNNWNPAVNTPVTISGKLGTAIPNVPLKVTITAPDNSKVDLTATSDAKGQFTVTYTPTTKGTYSVMGWWKGIEYYGYSFSDLNYINAGSATPNVNPSATANPATSNPTATPTNTDSSTVDAFPMTYVYAAIAVIVIVVIAAALIQMRRNKK